MSCFTKDLGNGGRVLMSARGENWSAAVRISHERREVVDDSRVAGGGDSLSFRLFGKQGF